jgi:CDP-diacylglycerol--serine O-phosphatidyltransferase
VSDSAVETPKRRFRRRRRRKRTGPPRGFYLLPHLITTAGLFFGFFAIVHAFTGRPDRAALGIVLAMLCDAVDGRVARLARSTSRFGVEYDSIADTVSFGVAPAMLAFSAGNLQVLGRTGWVMAFLFMACAALRLARFNVSPSRYRGRFEGMPSPAAAGVVATTQWFVSFLRENGVEFSVPEVLVAGGVAVLGLLMVSPIPYRSFKEVDLRHSYGTLVIVVIAATLVIWEPSVIMFAIGLVYTASGPLEWLWRRRAGRPLEEAGEPLPSDNPQG